MKNKKINIPEVFKLENVTLKRTSIDFAQQRVEVLHENFDHVMKFLTFTTKDYNLDDETAYIASCDEKWSTGKTYDFSIFENTTGKYIGSCSIMVTSKARGVFEFGYWLAKQATGKGYMTQIIKALSDFVKQEYNPRRMIIRCNDANLNSAGVALRNGFLFEGRGYCGDINADFYTFVKLQEDEKMQLLKSKQNALKQIFEVDI